LKEQAAVKAFEALLCSIAILCPLVPAARGQNEPPTRAATAPPEILLFVHQQFQFGREGARERLEAAVARACDRISVPNSWISLQALTGEPEALSFDPFDSYAHIEESFWAWSEIYSSHPELGRMQEQIRTMQTGERTLIAVRRNELSYEASTIDLSKARFMRVLEVQVRPGHEDDFEEAFGALRAAYLKISADLPWVVYQVNAGGPSPTYLAFVPMASLKGNDDLLSWRGLLRDAEGEEAVERIKQIARDAYISTESNVYAVRPDLSHVTKEFAEGDPEFWSPKPAAAEPGAKKPEAPPASKGSPQKPEQQR
jgi:hypothetical protein